MTTAHQLWDEQSSKDFWLGECNLVNQLERFDRDWISEHGIEPDVALARCREMRRTLDFMIAAASWARP